MTFGIMFLILWNFCCQLFSLVISFTAYMLREFFLIPRSVNNLPIFSSVFISHLVFHFLINLEYIGLSILGGC